MDSRFEAKLRAHLHRIVDNLLDAALSDVEAPVASLDLLPGQSSSLGQLRKLPALVPDPSRDQLALGELSIDFIAYEAFSGGIRVPLTRREFALLSFLARNHGRACARDEILATVWPDRERPSARTIDIHVHRLRHKLGAPFTERIETLRNMGYKLRTTPLSREATRRGHAVAYLASPPGHLPAVAGLRE